MDFSIGLLIVFIVSLVIILIVIGINIYISIKTNNKIKTFSDDISIEQRKVKKMNDDINAQNITLKKINDDILVQKNSVNIISKNTNDLVKSSDEIINKKIKKVSDDVLIRQKKVSDELVNQRLSLKKVNDELVNQRLSLKKVNDELLYQKLRVNEYKSEVKNMGGNVDVILSKINTGIEYKVDSTAFSILDLKEFKDLDPYLKDAYKRYIVNILSSALMKGINKQMSDADVKKYLSNNQAQIDNMAYAIAKDLQQNGLKGRLS